jgi:CubicO group peptidase (beta-lactamase class C family)
MKKRIIFSVLIIALVSNSCGKSSTGSEKPKPPSPTVHDSRFATMLDSLRYEYDLPALAAAVVTDTGVVEEKTVGCRRYAGEANVTDNDQFHLGSDTKALTAVLIGYLVDDGLLTWDTTLPTIFPEYAEIMKDQYKSVTVKDILSHAGGLVGNVTFRTTTTTVVEHRREVTSWALQKNPTNSRGTYYYSNVGFILAAAIADKLTGRPYEDLLFERVLSPLGITTAGWGSMGTIGLEDQPLQHTPKYKPLEPTESSDNPPVYNSAGRLHMSVGDWGKYIQWVLACEAGNSVGLRPETAAVLTTGVVTMPGEGSYAFGWAVLQRDWAGGKALTHSGSNTYNFAVAWLAPNRKFGVIAATNICASTTPASMDAVIGKLIEYHLSGR